MVGVDDGWTGSGVRVSVSVGGITTVGVSIGVTVGDAEGNGEGTTAATSGVGVMITRIVSGSWHDASTNIQSKSSGSVVLVSLFMISHTITARSILYSAVG